jgi:sugar phosphate isomerase/epimerase
VPRHDVIASFFTLAGDTRLAALGGTEISPHDLRRRIEVAGATGYTGFGFADRDLRHWSERYPMAEIRRFIQDSGIRVVEIEMLTGWHLDGERRAASDALQADILRWAGDLGARHVKVCADLGGVQSSHEKFVEDFGVLCAAAAGAGTTIALEVMPLGAIKTPEQALAIIEDSGARNAGLLLDVWHLARGGVDFGPLSSLPADRIASVELNDGAKEPVDGDLVKDGSDYRRVAGTGELGVDEFVDAVLATGYDGPFGDENLSIDFRSRALQDAAETSYTAVRDLVARG